jgi:hypothetical protein
MTKIGVSPKDFRKLSDGMGLREAYNRLVKLSLRRSPANVAAGDDLLFSFKVESEMLKYRTQPSFSYRCATEPCYDYDI